MTVVTRWPDDAKFEYSATPRSAVIAAYAQNEKKDFNTWDYAKYDALVKVSLLYYYIMAGDAANTTYLAWKEEQA